MDNGESYNLKFYSKGFFGYGEKGDFKPRSAAHIIPVLFTVAVIILISVFAEPIRLWQYERYIRTALAIVMLFCEFGYFWRLVYVGPTEKSHENMMMYLPMQICEWTLLFTVFMLMLESQQLFSMVFYLTMSCGLIPFVTPAVISRTGPRYFRYYQFWGEHILPIITVFYMMIVCGYRPQLIGILYQFIMLGVMLPFAIKLNRKYQDCVYLYLEPGRIDSLRALEKIKPMSVRVVVYSLIIAALSFVAHGVYLFVISML